jgi:hypothetical protein
MDRPAFGPAGFLIKPKQHISMPTLPLVHATSA